MPFVASMGEIVGNDEKKAKIAIKYYFFYSLKMVEKIRENKKWLEL